MAKTTVAQALNKLGMSASDKKTLTSLFTSFVDDIETLRANQRAAATKLDADAGVTDTNYAATTSSAAGTLIVGK